MCQADSSFENMIMNIELAHGESRLECFCRRSTGVWYLGCQYLLAFTKADMANTKRTYWWLSRICRRTFDKQKRLGPKPEPARLEIANKKPRLATGLVNVLSGDGWRHITPYAFPLRVLYCFQPRVMGRQASLRNIIFDEK